AHDVCAFLFEVWFSVSVAKVGRAGEVAHSGGFLPGAGGPGRFGDEDGEEHPKQAHQQADDGEAASKHWVRVSFNTQENALTPLNRL
ncbi:hypothetical protein, partial [Mesorhizobium sp. M8A.F.Ca.ET.021.01.1.1]|uniref:hypothetical protein n=1 Tax=Mesorhizobium sp. M8A.F.Ca.ET.021.01.1.1 TaxID=2496757 RepID=UPI001AECE5BA